MADALGDGHDLVEDVTGAGKQRLAVMLRHDEGVAFGRLRDVEDGEDVIVLIDLVARDFAVDDTAEDIIGNHMWPMTLTPPHTIEGFIITIADKYSAVTDFLPMNHRESITGTSCV